jgi:opacity protein-like surface antigen
MTFRFRNLFILVATLSLSGAALSQDYSRFNLSAGAGFSSPTQGSADRLDTGWNINFRGGYNINQHLAADLDFAYDRWDLNSTALALFGEPGGHTSLWSLTFNPVYRLFPRSRVDVYSTAGFGLYHRNLSLTQPATFSTFYCDPFFGYCYPALVSGDVVVASFSTYKGGFNAGGGLEFRLGDSHLKAFAEARYSRMFTTHGNDMTYVPVTFGVRW